jgi:hypothetical protein
VSEESRAFTSNRPQDGLVRYKQSQNADRSVLPSIKRKKKKYFSTKYLRYAMALCKLGNHKIIVIKDLNCSTTNVKSCQKRYEVEHK